MPDLIDREAAVRAVKQACSDALDEIAEGNITASQVVDWIISEIETVFRALPAVDRRCATCRYWNELRADSEFGDCWGNTKLPTYRRNHYCAAWHPQDSQP